MTSDYSQYLQVAKDAAIKAGKKIAEYYGKALNVTHKSPEQPLTEADLAANMILKEALLGNFSDVGWLSEEDIDDTVRFDKEFLWVVDPLDGTRDFINRTPEFAVSVGLVHKKKPVVGVVYNPISKELFYAAKGTGAFCNGKKITVRKDSPGKRKLLASLSELKRGEWERFKDQFEIKPTGGCAYKMGKVATGVADGTFTLSPKSDWDICGGHCLIEEAGGIVRDVHGEVVTYNNEFTRKKGLIYCSSEKVLAEILTAIK